MSSVSELDELRDWLRRDSPAWVTTSSLSELNAIIERLWMERALASSVSEFIAIMRKRWRDGPERVTTSSVSELSAELIRLESLGRWSFYY